MKTIMLLIVLLCVVACSGSSAPDSAENNQAMVAGVYAAFAVGDMPAVVGSFASDIVWNEADNNPYADKNPYVGADAILSGLFARLGGDWTDFTATPSEFIADESHVAVTGRYAGTFNATGKTINAQFVHLWTVENDKIIAFQQYADTAQLVDAMSGIDEKID